MSKFKNTEELEKAYKELEREFTKKSQKLAEVEKTNYVTLLHNEMDNLLNDYAKRRISDLEAKLAEKIQKCQLLDDNYTRLTEKYDLLESRHELLIEENLKLEQQLAEKEKEIMELASKVDLLESEKENLFRTLEEANEDCQDKISFAVEQLEKVKEFVKENESWEIEGSDYSIVYADDVLTQIDNQIAELKK